MKEKKLLRSPVQRYSREIRFVLCGFDEQNQNQQIDRWANFQTSEEKFLLNQKLTEIECISHGGGMIFSFTGLQRGFLLWQEFKSDKSR